MPKIRLRGDTLANFVAAGTIPAAREVVVVTDLDQLRVGNGSDTVAELAAIGSASGSQATPTTFAQAIKTDGWRTYGQVLQNSDINFTHDIAASIDGGEAYASVIADGSHDLVISDDFQLVGAQEPDMTAGRVNFFRFYQEFGVLYAAVNLGEIRDTVKPFVSSVTVGPANPTEYTVVLSENYSGTLVAASAFGITGKTISSRTGISANSFKLTTTVGAVYGETPTFSYTKPGVNNIKDAAGNEMDTVSGFAITNNMAATAIFSDNFNRANADPLDGGYTLQGNALQLLNNKVRANDSFNGGYYIAYKDANVASYSNKIKGNIEDNFGPHPCLFVRMAMPSGFRQMFVVHFKMTEVSLTKNDANEGTDDVIAAVAHTAMAQNNEFLLEAVVTPTHIIAKIDGATIASWANTDWATHDFVGFGWSAGNPNAGYIDDWVVTP